MPKYLYFAKSLKGEEKSGVLEAKDVSQLARILKKEGFILIKASKERKKKIEFPSFPISLTEKIFFCRNLQVMISAGLSLPRSLEILIFQTRNKKLKTILSNLKEEIVRGKSFSEAISFYPEVFSELFQSLIKVGEETGNLEGVLKISARQMEKERELKSRIIGALIYPAVIILTMILVGILMLVLVIPKLAQTFQELGLTLPLTTQIVINLANFLNQNWQFIILFLFFLIFLFLRLKKTKKGKKLLDFFFLKLPIISSIIKNTNSAFTSRNLSSLISAGISLPRSLEITANTLDNFFYQKSLIEAAERVRKGEKLSNIFSVYRKIYPPLLIEMIGVGEETGETSQILAKLANFYENEVERTTKNLASIIEPLIMVIIGFVIGFFAISMIQPIYSMLGAIK